MCGIFGIYPHKNAAAFTYLGLYALQHRGEEASGIITRNGKKTHLHKGLGLVSDVFDEKIIKTLRGEMAIGHVRYSTTGSSNLKNTQPFYVKSRAADIAIAHNGNLTNLLILRRELENRGALFQTTMDSEVIAHLLAHSKKEDYKDLIVDAVSHLEGAYSLVLMLNDILIGCRDSFGWRPLCLGKIDGAYVLASETCALDLIGAEYIRDIEPGEIVFIHKNRIESLKPLKPTRKAYCIFEYIYFARPDSNIFGHNVYEVRKCLGRQLFKESSVRADIVMPIPDSGTYAALGFTQASGMPFEYGMIRNHYIGRTFIQPTQDLRDFRVKIKLNPLRDVLNGKKVLIIEDSIVRGTTSRMRAKTLRRAGAKEIHMLVSCPPLRFPCYYGIDFPTKKELIASKHDIPWIKEFLGVDSLQYLSLEGMLSSMPCPKDVFCTSCFTGEYPVKPSCKTCKEILERY